jgi:hypothetical protein
MRGQGDRPGGGGGRDHSQVLCFKCGGKLTWLLSARFCYPSVC